jgi:DNA-binding YbaB/EbfC family protein
MAPRGQTSAFRRFGAAQKNGVRLLASANVTAAFLKYKSKGVSMFAMKMDKMMKQLQKMQAQMTLAQEALEGETVEGASGGGMVVAKANGHGDLVSISISKEVVDPNDVEMLEDLVLSAVRESIRLSRELKERKMIGLTGGMNIPGLF